MNNIEQAKIFAKSLFEDVISNGKFELLSEYYSPEMTEHYNDLEYNFDDIKNRLMNVTSVGQKYKLKVESVDASTDFIFCLCRKIFQGDNYDLSMKEFEFWVCRIKNNKICESWCMVEKVANSGRQISAFFA
jgi:predicted SnoaL-like aldol condensation-catalyzing enzyme